MDSNRLCGIADVSPLSTTANAMQVTHHIIGFNKQVSQPMPSSSATSASYHRKSQSLDAATISSQLVNTSMGGSNAPSAAVNGKNKAYAVNER